MFDKIDEYQTVHAVAHKRGAPAIGAPALTRQIVVTCSWADYEREYSEESDPDHPHHSKRDFGFVAWQSRNIRQTYFVLCEQLGIPEERFQFMDSAYQVFDIDDLIVKFVLDCHKDHLAMQISIDLEKSGRNLDIDVRRIETESNLGDLIRGHIATICDADVDREDKRDSSAFLKESVWAHIEDLLCPNDIEGLNNSKLILDLRGCTFEDASDDVDAKIAKLAEYLDLGESFRRKEIVCCTLFRDSCVYMSPIGSNIDPSLEANRSSNSTVFAVTAPSGNRWQTGRLMYRINQIATLRAMALKNLAEIRSAGLKMTQLGSRVEKLSGVDFKETKIQKKLVLLGRIKGEIDALGKSNSADLRYKIDRSKHFANRFYQSVDTMGIGRIEGWQPYTDFIERRLRPSFEHIASIGSRFEALTRAYHAQLGELDSELQRQNGEHLVDIQHEILGSHSFQHKIESIALAYYGGSIIYFCLFGLAYYLYSIKFDFFAFYKITSETITVWEKTIKASAFLVTSAFAFVYFRFQEWKHREKTREREWKREERMKGNFEVADRPSKPLRFRDYLRTGKSSENAGSSEG